MLLALVSWEEVAGSEQAFAKVADDDFLGVADGGQIDAGVPALKYIDVCRYKVEGVRGQAPGVRRGEEDIEYFSDTGCVHSRVIVGVLKELRKEHLEISGFWRARRVPRAGEYQASLIFGESVDTMMPVTIHSLAWTNYLNIARSKPQLRY